MRYSEMLLSCLGPDVLLVQGPRAAKAWEPSRPEGVGWCPLPRILRTSRSARYAVRVPIEVFNHDRG